MIDNFSLWEPVGNYLLLEPKLASERTDTGLIIPDVARHNLTQGKIVKTGDGPIAVEYNIGEEVVFTAHSETRMEIDGKPYILLNADNVILRKPNKNA